MSYHFWEDSEYAGPGPADLIRFWDRAPRTLRHNEREILPVLTIDSGFTVQPKEATPADAKEIAVFWNSYYREGSWKFNCNYQYVENVLNRGFILIVRNGNKELIATFVARILNDGLFCGSLNSQCALLEGFVIHDNYRKKGLGSVLLAHMDRAVYARPELRNAILIWFREHASAAGPVPQLPLAILQYTFCMMDKIPAYKGRASKPLPEMVQKIVKTVYQNYRSQLTLLSCETTDPDLYWFLAGPALIGIADTHRYDNTTGRPFWEVMFAANIAEPHFTNLREPIMMAARELPSEKGILFASNSLTRGNLTRPAPNWVIGGGYLSIHIYNWMPPAFFTGDLLFPHSCL